MDLSVVEGKVTVVFGRNGVGKTTLLRCLSGLIPASHGRIFFGDTEITKWSPSRRVQAGLAHVPEGRRMVAGFTVRQSLLLGGQILPRRQVIERLEEVLSVFPAIEKWLGREATLLSGGQQQLVAIARALMARARVLMLDEPLTGLSPSVAFNVLESVKGLAEQGLTVLLVEQNVHMAMEIADSVCVLDSGLVAELDGTAQMEMADRIERVYLGLDLTRTDRSNDVQ